MTMYRHKVAHCWQWRACGSLRRRLWSSRQRAVPSMKNAMCAQDAYNHLSHSSFLPHTYMNKNSNILTQFHSQIYTNKCYYIMITSLKYHTRSLGHICNSNWMLETITNATKTQLSYHHATKQQQRHTDWTMLRSDAQTLLQWNHQCSFCAFHEN